MATVSGLEFSDDGVLTVTPRPGEGVPDTATVMGGWAADENGAAYIEAASVVPSDAVQIGGLSYTQDGALYVTSAAPSNPVYIGGRAVRQDGALHVKTGTPSGDDQALGGWMTSNAGVAYVDLLPSFWLPLKDASSGEVDITLGMGTGSGTFTRATTATTVDSTGTIVSVASGVPRSYYDPTTLEYRGYLAEGARTNLALSSADMRSNAAGNPVTAWINTDVTITTGSGTAPDGTNTLNLATEGTAGTALLQQNYTGTSNTNQVFSPFLKYGNCAWIRINVKDTVTGLNRVEAWVNVQTGVVGSVSNVGTATGTSISLVTYPNGIYRVSVSGAVNNAATALSMTIHSASADGSTTRVNNATYYVWGCQLENNVSFASTYIPTTTASVTRNADVLTYPMAGNFSATAGTIYCEAMTSNLSATKRMLEVGDGTANERYNFNFNNSPTVEFFINDGGATSSILVGTPVVNTVYKIAGSYAVNDIKFTVNGATPGTDTSQTLPTVTTLRVGNWHGAAGTELFGTIKNIRIWTTQFSAAQLQAVTA